MSLKKQTFSGLIWTFTDVFLLRGASFAATIALARLIGPSDFGLIGMITVFIAIGACLIESGLSASLIRDKNAGDKDYSTVFYLNVGTSFLVYIILFLCAPFISDFYKVPLLTTIIRLYCLNFITIALSAVQVALLNKNMQFKKLMHLNLPGTLIGVTVGIIMGYQGYGVYSIIWMYLITQAIQTILLWIFSDWKPSFVFSVESMKHHYKFGYKLLLSGLLDTVFKNIYNILIGRFYPVKFLGYYDRAYTLSEYPVTTISGIVGKVSYPLMAQIQDQTEKVSRVYKQMIQITFFVVCPLMIGAAAISEPLFLLFLGKEWLQAAVFFKIICLASILYPIHAFNITVLKVYGRSDLFLKLEVIKKVIAVVGVIAAFQLGIYGLIWSSVVLSFISLIINTHYSSGMINYTTKNQLLDMLPVLVISAIMYYAMTLLLHILVLNSLYLQIVLPTIVGFFVYILINFFINATPFILVLKILKERKL